ncbi:MAG: biotin/lipoyl-containing protein [Candidatus Aminicenantales bacterium]
MKLSFWSGDKEYKVNLEEKEKNMLQVTVGGEKYAVGVEFLDDDELLLSIDGRVYDTIVNRNSTGFSVFLNGKNFRIEKKTLSQILGGQPRKQKRRDVKSSMPGRIIKILVKKGDKVKEGQAVLILEAMKMENEIKTPQSGVVTRLDFKPGDYVETGNILFSVE